MYEAIWRSPEQSHESLCSKWTISYHCEELWRILIPNTRMYGTKNIKGWNFTSCEVEKLELKMWSSDYQNTGHTYINHQLTTRYIKPSWGLRIMQPHIWKHKIQDEDFYPTSELILISLNNTKIVKAKPIEKIVICPRSIPCLQF